MKMHVRRANGTGIHGVIVVYLAEEVEEQEHLTLVCQRILFVAQFPFLKNLVMKRRARLELGFGWNGVIAVRPVVVESEQEFQDLASQETLFVMIFKF